MFTQRIPLFCTACGLREEDVVTVHKFPEDAGRCRLWAKIIWRYDLLDVAPDVCQRNFRLCCFHFARTDFICFDRLRDDAVPLAFGGAKPPGRPILYDRDALMAASEEMSRVFNDSLVIEDKINKAGLEAKCQAAETARGRATAVEFAQALAKASFAFAFECKATIALGLNEASLRSVQKELKFADAVMTGAHAEDSAISTIEIGEYDFMARARAVYTAALSDFEDSKYVDSLMGQVRETAEKAVETHCRRGSLDFDVVMAAAAALAIDDAARQQPADGDHADQTSVAVLAAFVAEWSAYKRLMSHNRLRPIGRISNRGIKKFATKWVNRVNADAAQAEDQCDWASVRSGAERRAPPGFARRVRLEDLTYVNDDEDSILYVLTDRSGSDGDDDVQIVSPDPRDGGDDDDDDIPIVMPAVRRPTDAEELDFFRRFLSDQSDDENFIPMYSHDLRDSDDEYDRVWRNWADQNDADNWADQNDADSWADQSDYDNLGDDEDRVPTLMSDLRDIDDEDERTLRILADLSDDDDNFDDDEDRIMEVVPDQRDNDDDSDDEDRVPEFVPDQSDDDEDRIMEVVPDQSDNDDDSDDEDRVPEIVPDQSDDDDNYSDDEDCIMEVMEDQGNNENAGDDEDCIMEVVPNDHRDGDCNGNNGAKNDADSRDNRL